MRLRLVNSRRWPPLRGTGFVALMLAVLLLAGAVPARQVEAQDSKVLIAISFSPQTPPLQPGLICRGQDYEIEVRPEVPVGAGMKPVPLFGGTILTMTKPDIGTLNATEKPSA